MARPKEVLLQALLLSLLARAPGFLLATARDRMAVQGIPFSFAFLGKEAGFSLSEGVAWSAGEGLRPYLPSDAYWQALLAGFFNTLKVALLRLLGALLVAMGRLSGNPLARGIAFAYVELVRNTPLLLQLFTWYFGVFLKLPPWEEAVHLGGSSSPKGWQKGAWPQLPFSPSSALPLTACPGPGGVARGARRPPACRAPGRRQDLRAGALPCHPEPPMALS